MAQILAAIAAVIGVPVVIFYARETAKLRRISQRQLDAMRSPVVFFDNPTRATEPGWENIWIVNGGGGPALNVEYRIGDEGDSWVTIPALLSGERKQITHDIGHMIHEAGRNRQMESTIYVRCRGWSGEHYESRAVLESKDRITFHLKVQRPDNDL